MKHISIVKTLGFICLSSVFLDIFPQKLSTYQCHEEKNKRREHDLYPIILTDQEKKLSKKSKREVTIEENYNIWSEASDTIILPKELKFIRDYFAFIPVGATPGKELHSRYVIFPEGIKTIGAYSFYKSGLVEVDIPASVVDIKTDAFALCRNLKRLNLGDVRIIGIGCLQNCGNLQWVDIPLQTRLIGNHAFWGCNLFFVQLSPTEVNPVGNFFRTFGKKPIAYIACSSEFLNPGVKAKYQSDMPEVFVQRAMIHLEESPVPIYFSFELTGEKEGLWQPGIDLWAFTNSENTSETNEATSFKYPVIIRPDFSLIPERQLKMLRIYYNEEDITTTLKNGKLVLDKGNAFNIGEWKAGNAPIYNRLKITLGE